MNLSNQQEVISLIQNRRETPTVDFKRDFYKKLKNSDFAKDIAAFANVSGEDKYLIFGIDDKSREIVGIPPQTFPPADDLDAYLNHAIEPFVDIESGIFEYKKRMIGYIKILASNVNPPYMIKETCGPGGKTEKGDIYIRKGTCNQKASRMDLDTMYMDNGQCTVRIFEDILSIELAYAQNDSEENSAQGRVSVEIYNSSARPLLFSGGAVDIFCEEVSLSRRIFSLLPSQNLQDTPLEILPKTRRVYTALFSFSRSDCVMLGFDKNGRLPRPTSAQILLIDTDQKKYMTEKISVVLIAHGDFLQTTQKEALL